MPTGPKGEKRPASVTSNAVPIIKNLEIEEGVPVDDGKNPHAKALGARGGAARARNMTPERRVEVARKAAAKRWSKQD